MAKIAPSILSCDFFNLGNEIKQALDLGVDWIHIDVMDGHFVPPLTFGSKIVSDIKKHINCFCDVHLMVTNPEDHIIPFINAKADLINFHCEPVYHGDRYINQIKDAGILAGITLNPSTPISFIEHYLPLVDIVLVMSVNPGYSGQKCIPYNLEKIKKLKQIREQNNYKYLIQIDGGINIDNVIEPLNYGADVIVAGSGYFDAKEDIKQKLISKIHNFSN